MNQRSNPLVSVIIPVFNDTARLKLCLQALEQQTYPKDRYEVIVINNNSHEDVESVVNQFKQVLLTHENRPGSYAARNAGLTLAKGEAIAFTDSDCIPNSTWLENGIKALQSAPDIGLVAGRIDLFVKDPQNPNPIELYESIALSFPQDRFIEDEKFGVTANLFTSKAVLNDVGQFNASLKSAGDKEWGQRVFAKGYRQVYADDARINHPARDSWEQICKRSVRIIGGQYDLMTKDSPSNFHVLINLILFLKPPFRSFFRIWTDARLHGLKQKFQFTVVMLRLRVVAIRERFRLQFGDGTARRG